MIHASLLARRSGRALPLWFMAVKISALLFMLGVLIWGEHHKRVFRQACGSGYDVAKFHSPECQAFYK